MSCFPECHSSRKVVRKSLDSWRHKLLLTVGLETIGPELSSDWSTFSGPLDIGNFDPVSVDFSSDSLTCAFCSGPGVSSNIMSLKDDSGVSSNSTTPAISPRVDVLNSLTNPPEPVFNPEIMQQMMYQQAVQMEIFHNMQMMMGIAPVAPHLPFSAEVQRLILDNQIPFANHAIMAQQQMAWHQMMMSQMQRPPHIAKEVPVERNEQSPSKPKDDRPLDLSRKSGLETILELEGVPTTKKVLTEDPSTPPPKRNYSQMDLDAAVNDIRNGKLGTRRASVVYGIPRSTLRNKIYKLEAADEMTGGPAPFKRRRPGGQSSEEKKVADDTEREKRSSSTTPRSDDSMNGSGNAPTPEEKPPSALDNFDSLRLSNNGWPSNIWASLFGNQQACPTTECASTRKSEISSRKDDGDWKKSRPKRGQYRKYDKNALDEAVQSVRRGEMSVHRAGSFYGVPHSTLEYKVKERNLMRKKKCDEAEACSPNKTSDEMASSPVDISVPNFQEVLSN